MGLSIAQRRDKYLQSCIHTYTHTHTNRLTYSETDRQTYIHT